MIRAVNGDNQIPIETATRARADTGAPLKNRGPIGG
jgi:hypothetical protein